MLGVTALLPKGIQLPEILGTPRVCIWTLDRAEGGIPGATAGRLRFAGIKKLMAQSSAPILRQEDGFAQVENRIDGVVAAIKGFLKVTVGCG